MSDIDLRWKSELLTENSCSHNVRQLHVVKGGLSVEFSYYQFLYRFSNLIMENVKMNQPFRYAVFALCSAVVLGLTLLYSPAAIADDSDYVPNWTGYQGYLTDGDGNPFNGEADLYFAVYDASEGGNKEWSEYHDNVEVGNGYFYVMLGGDDAAMGYWNYENDQRYMEVRVCRTSDCAADGTGPGWETLPRQSMGAVPYAMRAHRAYSATWASMVDWSGIKNVPAGMGGGYKYYVSVAKEGGDYTSLYDAVQSITDAGAEKPYLIYVAPGIYEETQTIVTKPYVHIKGAGKYATTIKNATTDKTLVLSSHVSIYGLTIRNGYPNGNSYAIYAHDGNYGAAQSVYLHDIYAYADYNSGGGYQYDRYGIYLYGGNVEVHANYGYFYGEYGVHNYGAYITNGAHFYAKNSHFYGSYGTDAWGVYNTGNGTLFDAYYVKAWGRYAQNYNYGLYNVQNALAKLYKGFFYGKYGNTYGNWCYGIYNAGATVEAHYVYGYGYECIQENYGLYNKYDGGPTSATVKYSYFKGYKGYRAYGIYNAGYNGGAAAELHAHDTYAYGDESAYNGSSDTGLSYGLLNSDRAKAWLYGGVFRGYKGYDCYGIANNNVAGSTIEARTIEAYGKYCTIKNYGVYNKYGQFTVYGGTFYGYAETTGGEGQNCIGVYNASYDGTYRAVYTGYDVSAWGQNCYANAGLYNGEAGYATTYNGTYYSYGGNHTYGAFCADSGSKLYLNESNLYGKVGSGDNYGYYVTNACHAYIHGGVHYGEGGQKAYGGWCGAVSVSGAECHIAHADVWAKDGSANNYGHYNGDANTWYDFGYLKAWDSSPANSYYAMYVTNGTVYAGNSKFDDGGAGYGGTGGTLNCYNVYKYNYTAVTCPGGLPIQ